MKVVLIFRKGVYLAAGGGTLSIANRGSTEKPGENLDLWSCIEKNFEVSRSMILIRITQWVEIICERAFLFL